MSSYLEPVLFKNESSYSYVARASLINGYSYFDDVMRRTGELVLEENLKGVPITLSQVFKFFDVRLPFKPLLVYESFGNAHTWRFCETCYQQELKTLGTGYWHLDHQLPASFICLEHFKLLHKAMVPKQPSHKLGMFLPQDISEKRVVSLNSVDFETVRNWVTIAKDVASKQKPVCWMPLIQLTMIERYRDLGFSNRFEVDIINDWGHYFRSVGYEGLIDLRILTILFSANKQVGLRYQHLLPAVLIIVIQRLYGSFEAFYEAYRWQEVMSVNCPLMQSQKLKFPGREYHRNCCIEFLSDNPSASRTDFWRAREVTCHWLMKNDYVWLSRVLPAEIKKFAFQQMDLFKTRKS